MTPPIPCVGTPQGPAAMSWPLTSMTLRRDPVVWVPFPANPVSRLPEQGQLAGKRLWGSGGSASPALAREGGAAAGSSFHLGLSPGARGQGDTLGRCEPVPNQRARPAACSHGHGHGPGGTEGSHRPQHSLILSSLAPPQLPTPARWPHPAPHPPTAAPPQMLVWGLRSLQELLFPFF